MSENECSDLWNLKRLEPPPFVTFEYTNNELETRFANKNHFIFNDYLNKLYNLLESSEVFMSNEKHVLEKLIYKNWNPLRKEKSLQFMRKLKTILGSFEDMKLSSLARDFKDLKKPRTQAGKELRSVPSKELHEYFLVRLLAAFNLLNHAVNLIRDKIFVYLSALIQSGIYLPNNLLFLSVVARIFCLFKKYAQLIVLTYNNLREYVGLFKSTNIIWSSMFELDKLPLKININLENNESKVVNLEKKLDQLVLLDNVLQEEKNEELYFEDIGEKIDRNHLQKTESSSQNQFSIDKEQKLNSKHC